MNEKMQKVLIIFDGVLDLTKGGAERFTFNLACSYRRLGLEPIVLGFDQKINKIELYKNNKPVIIMIPTIKVIGRSILFKKLKYMKLLIKLIEIADIVHILYGESVPHFISGLLARFLFKKKLIVSPLASISFIKHHSLAKRFLSLYLISVKLLLTKIANLVHVASLYDYYSLLKINKNIIVIPHSLKLKTEKNNKAYNRLCAVIKQRLFEKFKDKIKICYMGRFTEDKGAKVLLSALEKLIQKQIKVILVIIGSKRYVLRMFKSYITSNLNIKYFNIKNYIIMLGFVPDTCKYTILSECDLGVLPSLSDPVEAFSIILSEFNFLGIPVVASNVGALKFRVKPYAGILVKPRDPEALARGIMQALQLKGKVKRLPDTITYEQEVRLWGSALKELLKS